MDGASEADTVEFNVAGQLFTVAVSDLQLSRNPESLLTRAVLTATNCKDPIYVDGDADLFLHILDMHRLLTVTGGAKCRIPSTVPKAVVVQEAYKFGLVVSAEDIVQEGDQLESWRDGQCCVPVHYEQSSEYFRSWTANQVADWLKTFQQGRFGGYADRFVGGGIDGMALSKMTDDDLKSLGMIEPRLRGVFLSAVESTWQTAGAFTVDADEESARVALQKHREANPDSADEDGPNLIDAAVLNLQTVFGKFGTREMFTAMIKEWRMENSPAGHGKDASTGKASHKGILVAARIRPVLAEGPDGPSINVGDFESVTAATTSNVVVHSCGMQRDGTTPKTEHKPFHVHRALGPSCNEEAVFGIAVPLVDAAVKHSVHTTLLCYGQTGSGKTHTVGHLAANIVRHLYDHLNAKCVVLEAFELKGGAKGLVVTTSQAFSLHADDKPELSLLEGQDGAIHVGGSNGVVTGPGQAMNLSHCTSATSVEELLKAFLDASQRRSSTDTTRNATSSRTHAFYRFHLAAAMPSDNGVTATGACIELVDLAGSESNKDSLYHNKARIDERAKINSSLQALNTCIQKTVQAASYVPFRADKLTQLLRPCFERHETLEGVASVLFMACLSPLASDSQQSVRTLTYTQQMTGMSAKPKQSANQKRVQLEGSKRLAAAVETGDASQIRAAITVAHHSGVVGPARKRAQEALQKLEALEAEGCLTQETAE